MCTKISSSFHLDTSMISFSTEMENHVLGVWRATLEDVLQGQLGNSWLWSDWKIDLDSSTQILNVDKNSLVLSKETMNVSFIVDWSKKAKPAPVGNEWVQTKNMAWIPTEILHQWHQSSLWWKCWLGDEKCGSATIDLDFSYFSTLWTGNILMWLKLFPLESCDSKSNCH